MQAFRTRTPSRPRAVPGGALPAAFALLASATVLAQDAAQDAAPAALTADALTGIVQDKTYQGSMTADAFAEYYAPDGTIRGDGYTGKWRAEDGALCFAYGDAAEQCWDVVVNGPAMTLIKDGEVDGSGMLVEGNPLGL